VDGSRGHVHTAISTAASARPRRHRPPVSSDPREVYRARRTRDAVVHAQSPRVAQRADLAGAIRSRPFRRLQHPGDALGAAGRVRCSNCSWLINRATSASRWWRRFSGRAAAIVLRGHGVVGPARPWQADAPIRALDREAPLACVFTCRPSAPDPPDVFRRRHRRSCPIGRRIHDELAWASRARPTHLFARQRTRSPSVMTTTTIQPSCRAKRAARHREDWG
jgi:hypothetical protein